MEPPSSLPLAGVIDVDRECERLRGELAALDKQLAALRGRLANEAFLTRAKPEVIEAEQRKEGEWNGRRALLATKLETLCGG